MQLEQPDSSGFSPYGRWGRDYGYSTANLLLERDAYAIQIQMGGGSAYDAYNRFDWYMAMTKHVKRY